MVPQGASLPSTFTGRVDGSDDRANCGADDQNPCLARPFDVDGDGQDEVLLFRFYQLELWDLGAEGWSQVAAYEIDPCRQGEPIEDRLAEADIATGEAEWPVLTLGNDVVLHPAPDGGCDP